MTLILDAFDDRSVRLRLDEVVEHTCLPRSSCYRILEQLVRLGWLSYRPGGYALGARASRLGGGLGDNAELRTAALPLLRELHLRTGATVHLGILDIADVVYLDTMASEPAAPGARVGGRAPAYATALGKAMLAWSTPEDVDAALAGELRLFTPNTRIDPGVLHAELRKVRDRHGLAFERGEHVPGHYGVAAAVRGCDGVRGAIAVCGRLSDGSIERISPLILDTARKISARLDPDLAAAEPPPPTSSDGLMERLHKLIDDDTLL
ncbi:IclR family transcriptional regulator [Nocardia rhizosphaerihabitans]|uniref:IclR family transcriptional regulator n=1 Tax=Nocardia rhizosphaerihabitans TaxID=1691570 RepID=UPI00366ED741